MKSLALIAALAMFVVLVRVTYRSYQGDFDGSPFVPVLMIVLTTGIIGGLIAGAAL